MSRLLISRTRPAGSSPRLAVLLTALALVAGAHASAQIASESPQTSSGAGAAGSSDNAAQTAPDPALRVKGWEIGPYLGVGRHSLVDTSLDLGLTPDRDHVFIGLHFTRELASPHNVVIAYAPEVVPLLIITNTPKYVTGQYHYSAVCGPGCGATAYVISVIREPVAGFAVSPIGLESRFPVRERWNLYATGAAGSVWFTRPVPDMLGRRFNFTFEIGTGVRWSYSSRTSLRLGFKFHHLSNAGTAQRNPGIDGAIFMVGFDRAVGRHSDE